MFSLTPGLKNKKLTFQNEKAAIKWLKMEVK